MNPWVEFLALLGIVLSFFGWGAYQRRRAEKAESKINEGKIDVIERKAQSEVSKKLLADLIADTNKQYPDPSDDDRAQ